MFLGWTSQQWQYSTAPPLLSPSHVPLVCSESMFPYVIIITDPTISTGWAFCLTSGKVRAFMPNIHSTHILHSCNTAFWFRTSVMHCSLCAPHTKMYSTDYQCCLRYVDFGPQFLKLTHQAHCNDFNEKVFCLKYYPFMICKIIF